MRRRGQNLNTERFDDLFHLGIFKKSIDRDVLEATWKNLADERILPRKQYPSSEGIKTILGPQKGVDPASVIDSQFIRELDQSGYIDRLYKK